PWTPRRRELELGRRLEPLIAPLDLHAECRAVADTIPAELRAETGLAGAERLGVRVARRHPELAPHLGKLLLSHSHQIDALAARDLHHRHAVLLRHVGDAAQLLRRRDATEDARDHAVRAVLLHVGVYAIVDEPRVALVVVLLPPDRAQQGREPSLAARVFVSTGQRG